MCYFCQKNVQEIDFKDIPTLMRFVSALYKIRPRKKTGLCAFHQRKVAKAIKRARQAGLMPYLRR